MTRHDPLHHAPGRSSLRVRALLFAAVWLLLPIQTAAHEEAEGVDAGFGHVIATVGADNVVNVELQITETDDCGKFRATSIVAERDTASVGGNLRQVDPCLFGGSVGLPERGRWAVALWVTFDGHPASIQLPVGASGEPGTFERSDWLHVEASVASTSEGAWYRPSGVLTYAIIGLLVGAAIELARRRLPTRPAG